MGFHFEEGKPSPSFWSGREKHELGYPSTPPTTCPPCLVYSDFELGSTMDSEDEEMEVVGTGTAAVIKYTNHRAASSL